MKFIEFRDDTKCEPTSILIDAHSIVAIEPVSEVHCRLYMSSGISFWVKGTLLEVSAKIHR